MLQKLLAIFGIFLSLGGIYILFFYGVPFRAEKDKGDALITDETEKNTKRKDNDR